jgi:hypothetical protein
MSIDTGTKAAVVPNPPPLYDPLRENGELRAAFAALSEGCRQVTLLG